MFACSKRTVGIQQQGPYRNEFLPGGALHAARAQLFALAGNSDAAFAELRRATDRGFRVPAACALRCLAAFDRFRAAPEYGAAEKSFTQLIEAEGRRVQFGSV